MRRRPEDKYFHAIVKQLSPDRYETVFEYYRLDPQTGAPIQVGATTMSTTVRAGRHRDESHHRQG